MGLQHAIKEVYNVTIWDYATDKPFAYIDYATSGVNENTAETVPIRGGQGNGLITTFFHTKDSKFNMSLPLLDLKLLALLGGEDMSTGAISGYKREEKVIPSGGSVTLAATPISGSQLVFEISGTRDLETEYTKVASAPATTQYSLTGAVLGFASADEGKTVAIWYKYTTAATTNKIAIKANKFPKTVKITAEGLWRDVEDDTDKAVGIVVYKAKPMPTFTITTSATNATTLDMSFDMYTVKDTNGDQQLIDYIVFDD